MVLESVLKTPRKSFLSSQKISSNFTKKNFKPRNFMTTDDEYLAHTLAVSVASSRVYKSEVQSRKTKKKKKLKLK